MLRKILIAVIAVSLIGIVLFSALLYANFSYQEGTQAFRNRNFRAASTYLQVALERKQSLNILKIPFIAMFTNKDIHEKLAVSYWEIKDYREAAVQYKAALQYESNNVLLITGLGNAYYFSKDYEQAKTYFLKLVKLKPLSADAHFFLGTAYEGLKQYEAAKTEYQKSISLDKRYALAYFYLAALHAKQNEKSEALANLKYAIELEPGMRKAAEEDKSFEDLRDDPEFKALMSTQSSRSWK